MNPSEILGPSGAIARHLPDYESREVQIKLAMQVRHALGDGGVLTAEAGTGTGKSLAYLIPAIEWSQENGKPVIVTTATIALQQQLAGKDLPFLASLPEFSGLTYAVAKGKGNYYCLLRAGLAKEAILQGQFDFEGASKLGPLLQWGSETETGDRSELAEDPGPLLWNQVNLDPDSCLKRRCPRVDDCFYYKAKAKQKDANIVVANHALFLADLAVRDAVGHGILPDTKAVVIDEAHHLESIATEHFGEQLSFQTLFSQLGRLISTQKKHRGSLYSLVAALDAENPETARTFAYRIEGEITREMESLKTAAAAYFNLFEGLEPGQYEVAGRIFFEKGKKEDPDLWPKIVEATPAFLDTLVRFTGLIAPVTDPEEEDTSKKLQAARSEVKSSVKALERFSAVLELFILGEPDENEWCRWIDVRESRKSTYVNLHIAPIDVAPKLKEALFDKFSSVVLTSATLTVGRSFQHLHRQLGISLIKDQLKIYTSQYDSPFDYQRNAKLIVPQDLPSPKSSTFERAAIQAIYKIANGMGGRTLVLFTSYAMLKAAVSYRSEDLFAGGAARIIYQGGPESRTELLRRMQTERNVVLFATQSFWEGIDLRGDALECVIIAKIPFAVPTEPIEKARTRACERRGGQPFMEISVPAAAIKLKQGFGRLIRSATDTGSVVILDNRLTRSGYGSIIMDSLPPAKRIFCSVDEAVRHCAGGRL